MERLVVATTNQGKLREFQAELKDLFAQIEGLPDDYVAPEETGSSFWKTLL